MVGAFVHVAVAWVCLAATCAVAKAPAVTGNSAVAVGGAIAAKANTYTCAARIWAVSIGYRCLVGVAVVVAFARK